MDEDLNTADAISAIFELISDINQQIKEGASAEFATKALDLMVELSNVLGLLIEKEKSDAENDGVNLDAIIEERRLARENKDWARADEIRDELKALGITLKDTPQGVQVIREK